MVAILKTFERIAQEIPSLKQKILEDQIEDLFFFKNCEELGRKGKQWEGFRLIESTAQNNLKHWWIAGVLQPSKEPVNFAISNRLWLKLKINVLYSIHHTMLAGAITACVFLAFCLLSYPWLSSRIKIKLNKFTPSIEVTGACLLLLEILSKALMYQIRRYERELRVNESANFHAFVRKYLIKKLNFTPTRQQLVDKKLHHLYRRWKNDAEFILRNK